MDYELISQTALFQGCSPSETEKLLHGLKTFTKKYKKGAPVYLAGTPIRQDCRKTVTSTFR